MSGGTGKNYFNVKVIKAVKALNAQPKTKIAIGKQITAFFTLLEGLKRRCHLS